MHTEGNTAGFGEAVERTWAEGEAELVPKNEQLILNHEWGRNGAHPLLGTESAKVGLPDCTL